MSDLLYLFLLLIKNLLSNNKEQDEEVSRKSFWAGFFSSVSSFHAVRVERPVAGAWFSVPFACSLHSIRTPDSGATQDQQASDEQAAPETGTLLF